MASQDLALFLATNPNLDLFKAALINSAYPELSKHFIRYSYAILVALSISILAYLAGFFLRWRTGKLRILEYDGGLTRLDFRLWLPLTCFLTSIFMITHIALQFKSYHSHERTFAFGFLIIAQFLPLAIGLDATTVSILADIPQIRTFFRKFDRSKPRSSPQKRNTKMPIASTVLLLSMSTKILSFGVLALAVAIKCGQAFAKADGALRGAISTVDEMVVTGSSDVKQAMLSSQISSLQSNIIFAQTQLHWAGIIFASFLTLYLFIGLPPIFMMPSVILKEIKENEDRAMRRDTDTVITLDFNKEHPNSNASTSEPFGNLQKTHTYPPYLQSVVNGTDSPTSKIDTLHRLLWVHIFGDACYAIFIAFLFSFSIYWSFTRVMHLSMQQFLTRIPIVTETCFTVGSFPYSLYCLYGSIYGFEPAKLPSAFSDPSLPYSDSTIGIQQHRVITTEAQQITDNDYKEKYSFREEVTKVHFPV